MITINMRPFLLFLLACLLLSGNAVGESIQINRALKKPDSISVLKLPNENFGLLQETIKSNSLEKFYKEFNIIRSIKIKDSERNSLKHININIWLFYYAAAVPLYTANYDDYTNWGEKNLYVDIETKVSIIMRARYFVYRLTEDACKQISRNLKKRDIAELTALYTAHILRSCREICIENIDVKQKKLENAHRKMLSDKINNIPKDKINAFDFIKDIDRKERNFSNKLIRNKKRNTLIKSHLELMENDFIKMLINIYPDNAHSVYKYIHMAGYEGDEPGELIDRTVGRSAKTEYLYQGKNGHRHDRKVKKSVKEAGRS